MAINTCLSRAEHHALAALLDARIELLRARTQAELHAGDEHSQLQITAPVDERDNAASEWSGATDILVAERDVKELAELEAARQRLDTADFGICVDCRGPIPFARLRAQPTAECCIACQSTREHARAR